MDAKGNQEKRCRRTWRRWWGGGGGEGGGMRQGKQLPGHGRPLPSRASFTPQPPNPEGGPHTHPTPTPHPLPSLLHQNDDKRNAKLGHTGGCTGIGGRASVHHILRHHCNPKIPTLDFPPSPPHDPHAAPGQAMATPLPEGPRKTTTQYSTRAINSLGGTGGTGERQEQAGREAKPPLPTVISPLGFCGWAVEVLSQCAALERKL
jgi:hypothetical protein